MVILLIACFSHSLPKIFFAGFCGSNFVKSYTSFTLDLNSNQLSCYIGHFILFWLFPHSPNWDGMFVPCWHLCSFFCNHCEHFESARIGRILLPFLYLFLWTWLYSLIFSEYCLCPPATSTTTSRVNYSFCSSSSSILSSLLSSPLVTLPPLVSSPSTLYNFLVFWR